MLGSKMETLLAVAEFQNFTKAAASLSLTQPAVSIISISWKKNWESPFLSAEKAV